MTRAISHLITFRFFQILLEEALLLTRRSKLRLRSARKEVTNLFLGMCQKESQSQLARKHPHVLIHWINIIRENNL